MTKEKQSSCSLGGARLTFVWVIELEDVGSRRVIWQHHHPSSNTHLLTGAGLVLRQIWDYSGLDSVQCLNRTEVSFISFRSSHIDHLVDSMSGSLTHSFKSIAHLKDKIIK